MLRINSLRETIIKDHVAKMLVHRRTLMGIPRESLAERIGTSRSQIQRYEDGERSIPAERLALIAEYLGVTIEFFIPKEAKDV